MWKMQRVEVDAEVMARHMDQPERDWGMQGTRWRQETWATSEDQRPFVMSPFRPDALALNPVQRRYSCLPPPPWGIDERASGARGMR